MKVQDFIERITSHSERNVKTAFNGGQYILERARRIYELPHKKPLEHQKSLFRP
jgi:hypothetical protein